ncbi:uncharacterized protein LOC129731153 isoform X2 [Wyeomyia smithii]|nr:uncharacterized protein LOC129731153 isoform X2 [Wyeomyia smithii]
MNNYCIIQTTENEHTLLSVLPSLWIVKNGWKSNEKKDSHNTDGDDLCYWPQGVADYRLLEKTKKNPSIKPDTKVQRAFRCKIKMTKFESYFESLRELKIMEANSDTDEYANMKSLRKVLTATELFNQIQQTKPVPSPELKSSNKYAEFAEPPDFAQPDHKIDMRYNSSSLLESNMSENDFSGLPHTLLLNQPPVNDESSMTPDLCKVLQALHVEVERNCNKIEECKLVGNRSIALLSQVNAKLDLLANQVNMKLDTCVSHKLLRTEQNGTESISAPLSPVKSEEFKSLEKKTDNKQFVEAVIKYLGSMHGKSQYVGEGGTVCLQNVDYFFDREFLMNCSWTGTSRNKNSEENIQSKIPFHKFDGVINSFHKVVMFSDPSYSLVQTQNFLKRCLRNAKQCFSEIKGIRASVAK